MRTTRRPHCKLRHYGSAHRCRHAAAQHTPAAASARLHAPVEWKSVADADYDTGHDTGHMLASCSSTGLSRHLCSRDHCHEGRAVHVAIAASPVKGSSASNQRRHVQVGLLDTRQAPSHFGCHHHPERPPLRARPLPLLLPLPPLPCQALPSGGQVGLLADTVQGSTLR